MELIFSGFCFVWHFSFTYSLTHIEQKKNAHELKSQHKVFDDKLDEIKHNSKHTRKLNNLRDQYAISDPFTVIHYGQHFSHSCVTHINDRRMHARKRVELIKSKTQTTISHLRSILQFKLYANRMETLSFHFKSCHWISFHGVFG